jgi:hypothetical protein
MGGLSALCSLIEENNFVNSIHRGMIRGKIEDKRNFKVNQLRSNNSINYGSFLIDQRLLDTSSDENIVKGIVKGT